MLANLSMESGHMCSAVNQRCWSAEYLMLPSLAELRSIKMPVAGTLYVSGFARVAC